MRPWLVLAGWMTIGGVAHAQGTIQGDRVVVLRLYNGLNAIDLLGDGHRGAPMACSVTSGCSDADAAGR